MAQRGYRVKAPVVIAREAQATDVGTSRRSPLTRLIRMTPIIEVPSAQSADDGIHLLSNENAVLNRFS